MSPREAYKKKIDAELDMVQEKLARFKAQGIDFTSETRAKHAIHVKELEEKLDSTKAKLSEIEKADEHVWEQLRDGFEDTWTTLQATLEDMITSFKEEKDYQ
jgi:septal ring factor EnvC (AmiA/AmiB activator)